MILQINMSGSWRNVDEFDAALLPRMQALAIRRAHRLPAHVTWRVIGERAKSPTVLYRMEGGALKWRKA